MAVLLQAEDWELDNLIGAKGPYLVGIKDAQDFIAWDS